MAFIRKYSITLALVLLIVASLGTYYAYGANMRLPEYRLQTLEGDPAEAAGLRLEGDYVGGKGSSHLSVTTESSEYGNGKHPWMTVDNSWIRSEYSDIDALFREHKQFMRGKTEPNDLYQDTEWLVYANAAITTPDRRVSWKLDILREADGRRIRYEGEGTERKDKMDYAYVLDVQKIGDEVHVLTRQAKLYGDQEYRDEVFDAGTGKPVRSVKLLSFARSATPGREMSIDVVTDATPTASNSYAILAAAEQSVSLTSVTNGAVAADARTIDQLPRTLSRSVYAYSYETGELKELPLPFEKGDNESEPADPGYILEGQRLLSLSRTDEAVTVARYDVATGRPESSATIRADQIGEGRLAYAVAANNRIYLMVKTEGFADVPTVAAADAADGRILYKGQPVCVDANGRPKEQLDDVWLNYLSYRR